MKARQMAIVFFVFVAVVGLVASGCATIFSGTNQAVSVNSSPSDASVTIKTSGGNQIFSGKTPVTTKLARKNEYVVTITMPGYREQSVFVSQTFNTWAICNLTNIIFWGVDFLTGAMFKLEPEMISVSLTTAYTPNDEKILYATFLALDSQGQLRMLNVPLTKDDDNFVTR